MAVRNAKIKRYAVRKGGGGVALLISAQHITIGRLRYGREPQRVTNSF